MEAVTVSAGGCRTVVYAGDRPAIVYCTLHDEREAGQIWALLDAPRPTLAAVGGADWNNDLSPWPAPAVFRGGGDFGGQGPAYLARLTGGILPAVERTLGARPLSRCLAGYSLAGLFALWGACRSPLFDCAASMSGSLWYEGFTDGLTPPFGGLRRVYLSLGDRESRAKNRRMASVEASTRRVAEIFAGAGVQTVLELNPGGHFQDVPERIARGINAVFGGGEAG